MAPATMAEIFGNNFLMEGCRDGGESRKAGSVARKGLHVLREGRRGLEGAAQAARGTEGPPREGPRWRVRDGHELHLLRRSWRRCSACQARRGRSETEEDSPHREEEALAEAGQE